jgi:DNA polymerase I
MKTLLLIDGHALLYRFYHALPPLTTPDGSPIQAIYGVSNILLKLFREQKPDYIAAAIDRPEETTRKKEFQEYKAHRAPATDDLISQLTRMKETFEAFNITTLDSPGFEADDIIGTLVNAYVKEKDFRIIILSGDLDLLQLVVNEKVIVQIIKNGLESSTLYNEAGVYDRFKLSPNQLPDYKGLVGDTSDNIPGVPGIGPKTATELLGEFKTVDGVYENLMIIKATTVKKLEPYKDQALLSRKLATIIINVPISLPDLEHLRVKPLPFDTLSRYLAKLGFASLVERLKTMN